MKNVKYEEYSDTIEYIYFKKNVYGEQPLETNGTPTFHNAVEFKLITKGIYRYLLSGKEKTVKEGELVVIKPKEIHSGVSIKNTSYYTLVVNVSFLENVCGKYRIFADNIKLDKKIYYKLEENFLYASENWEKFDMQKKKGFVYEFIGGLAQIYDTFELKQNVTESVIGDILQYIQDHYAEELTIDVLAKKFGYTPSYFSFLFKKYTSMNFRDYLNRYRVDVACKIIIQDNNLPLWAVAEKVGYKSFVTFYRACKKYVPKSNKK